MRCSECNGEKGKYVEDWIFDGEDENRTDVWEPCSECEGTGIEPKYVVKPGNATEEDAANQFAARRRTDDAKFLHHPDIVVVNYHDLLSLQSAAGMVSYYLSQFPLELQEEFEDLSREAESLQDLASDLVRVAERQRPKQKIVYSEDRKPRTMDEAWGMTEIPARRDNSE